MLIGSNGAGKSNFTSAFSFLQNILSKNLQVSVGQSGLSSLLYKGRKVTEEIDFEVFFGQNSYLEMHHPILFNELVLSDKLFEHCAEIDETARNRMELIVRSLAEQNGVTEQLKADNQMEWVRQMNACKAQAEEIVKAELIYD